MQLDVDPRKAAFQRDEIRADALRLHTGADRLARKARRKAERDARRIQRAQHQRDVDALAAEDDMLRSRPVDFPRRQRVERHDIVDRRIQRNRINHVLSPP